MKPTTTIAAADHFYMVSDKGIVSCLDVKTGEPAWTYRMGGPHSAWPIAAGGGIH